MRIISIRWGRRPLVLVATGVALALILIAVGARRRRANEDVPTTPVLRGDLQIDVLPDLNKGLVTILTYGVLITRLGFYRDDWYLLSTGQSQGSAGIVGLFQIDRPLLGYLYAFAFRALGATPLAWQLAALLMRLTGNLTFFWLLRRLWPGAMCPRPRNMLDRCSISHLRATI